MVLKSSKIKIKMGATSDGWCSAPFGLVALLLKNTSLNLFTGKYCHLITSSSYN